MPVQPRLPGHALMLIFYLHGFASSAQSSKAAFFRTRLADLGVALRTPDFNEPDFSTLTITRMIEQVGAEIQRLPNEDVTLIGSSLGGFVAVQVAVRYPERVNRLVLLAPALDFSGNRVRDLGDRGVEEWQRTNRLDVFHHAFGRVMPVHYELFADAQRYDSMNARLTIPILIFQGRRDTAVDPDTVQAWSEARPNADLRLLDDDHQLHGSLEYIWTEMAQFLKVTPERPFHPPDAAPQA
jgi:uncharacterized protein